ncbi:MAG: Na+/glucose cotransporter, partial [Gammaproteobacteria bacterium]
VFPRLIATYAPAGLAGLMIAGLIAAIMSSVDSALNSASTLVIMDFVKPRRPALSARESGRLGRLTTLVMMALAVAWAPAITSFEGLFAYLQQAFAYVTAPLVALFALALRRRRPAPRAARAGTATGHVLSLTAFMAVQAGFLHVHFTLLAAILFVLTLGACVVWQRVLGETPTVDTLEPSARPTWHALPGSVHAGALLVAGLCAGLVWTFR